ncbi:MAG: aspartate--tRNA(Asn) ligase [Candidatus Curtissbacteria bacterium]|nr:aspartate--tRNA(Asn) ligase [Candidatus Curtissbacteria bacterium]
MPRTTIADTPVKAGEKVTVYGWVDTKRDHGKITFVDIHDYSGSIQAVGSGEDVVSLKPQYVVKIEGEVQKRPPAMVNKKLKTGEVELKIGKVEVLSQAHELPFDMGQETLDLELPTLLDFRSLTLRHPKVRAIFKVQEVIIDAFRRSLKEKDFTEFQSPVIIPQGAEGGSEMFEVKYFDHKALLAQSPQFYKQILVGVFERVFAVNKTLRAEPSVTTRHLAEVTTLDAEFGFIENWEEIIDMAEYVIKYIFDKVESEAGDELKLLEASLPKVKGEIPRIKLREAQEIIAKRTGREAKKEPDLSPEDEKEIYKWAQEEKDSELVFVTHFPTSKRPFYTFVDPEDSEYTLSFDLIGRGVEWLTGGQRVNDLEELTKRAKERGVDLAKSELYLQAFKYGMPPEGGFSFGSERITMNILGLQNVREASLFPRDMERVDTRFSTQEK